MDSRRKAVFFSVALLCGGFVAIGPPARADEPARAVPTAGDPALKESPAAQAAVARHQREADVARQEYERKVRLLQRECDAKIGASRKKCIASLTTMMADETKKGKLEAALAIKGAVTKLKAEGPAVWPKQILPQVAEGAEGAVVGTEGDKPRDELGDKGKAIAAGRGIVLTFNDEKKLRQMWTLPPSAKDWQIINNGLQLHGREQKHFESRFTWTGDCRIRLSCATTGYHAPTVHLSGEEFVLSDPKGGKVTYDVAIERKGSKILAKANGKDYSFNIKEAEQNKPTRLRLTYTNDGTNGIFIDGIKITTKELQMDPEGEGPLDVDGDGEKPGKAG